MNEPYYEVEADQGYFFFTFESVNEANRIKKIVSFQLIDEESKLYNLALVDILPDGTVSDLAVSNNRDMPKVLATVFRTILLFLNKRMAAKVLIRRSTPARTRLYQMVISKYQTSLEQKFQILGLTGADVDSFKRGIRYDGFIVSKQISD